MPVLSGNRRALNWYVKSHKFHNSRFAVCTFICSLFLLELWKCWQNELNCFYLTFYMHTFFVHSLPILPFWWVRKGKGAIPYSHPNLSFSVIIFSLSGWLAQGSNLSKKGYAGVLGYLCFLEHCCFLSAFEAISGLNGKPGLFGLSVYVLT